MDDIAILAPRPDDVRVHKAQQETFFNDVPDAHWETQRPLGSPRFHRWLLDEKVRRATDGVGMPLEQATVLVVCGGSGMDAELLARKGAAAVTSDLALAAALRARERAVDHGLEFVSIVADAERLPFQDRSVDVVYVHDGLHHLEDPAVGLEEMCRVARVAVSVSEPARSIITRAAVKIGLAQDVEDAGNVVARLETRAVSDFLRQRGFTVIRCERYAMLYRHRPGMPMRLLSIPGVFEVGTFGMRIANRLVGRWGNKLVVIGVRP